MATKRGEDLESAAKAVIRVEMGRLLNLAVRLFNLCSEIIQLQPSVTKLSRSEIVRRLLLQRVITDLRCSTILSELGYGIQAAAHATSIFEAWVTIAAIRDEAAATRWLNHKQERASFGKIDKLLRAALANVPEKKSGDRERLLKRHLEHYGQLCMAKHLNPIVERARGYIREGKILTFVHGPDISAKGLNHVLFALYSSALHAWFSLLAITKHGPPLTEAMMAEMKEISSEIRALQSQESSGPI
jgi:hypothetical protein